MVYLSGPMDGVSVEDGNGWRLKATKFLNLHDFEVYNPYERTLDESKEERTGKEVHDNDVYWLNKSDIVLANLTLPETIKAKDSMFFTIGEVYLANRDLKPVVAFTNCFSHRAGYQATVTKNVKDLDEALDYIVRHYK